MRQVIGISQSLVDGAGRAPARMPFIAW
jgi:hypothetical protein